MAGNKYGSGKNYSRQQAQEELRRRGATVAETVGKTTQILVAGEAAGSKLAKAQKLGITILDEVAFLEKLGETNG